MYPIFPNTKSPVQINTFKKFLKEVVASGDAGVAKPAGDVDKFVAALADPLYVEVTPVDANGNKTIRMSASGTAAVAAADAAPAAPKAPKTPLTFTLETGFTPPTPNRTGLRTSIYPFATMEVGQSFFIPATADAPDPAKSLASTVSAATRRYSTVVEGQNKPGRKPGTIIPVRQNTREFTIRSVEENGNKGARIYRTA